MKVRILDDFDRPERIRVLDECTEVVVLQIYSSVVQCNVQSIAVSLSGGVGCFDALNLERNLRIGFSDGLIASSQDYSSFRGIVSTGQSFFIDLLPSPTPVKPPQTSLDMLSTCPSGRYKNILEPT